MANSQFFEDVPRGEFRVCQSIGNVDAPIREPLIQRGDPFADAGLARVDLLPAADQTNDHAPVRMPVNARQQEFRLRLVKTGLSLLLPHELGCLLAIPSTLSFIKQRNVIHWRPRITQAFVPMSKCLVATFSPISVLPAPGTPVTKQMAL
jgi:hypothetical protein